MPSSSIVISPDPRLLDDAHDVADALGTNAVDATGGQRLVTARTLPDRVQERFGLFSEEREQEQLLLARRQPVRLLAKHVEIDRVRNGGVVEQLGRPRECRVDGPWRPPEAPEHEIAELVDRRRVAIRAEHVEQRLRRDDLPDRRGERRRADLAAHAVDLDEHLVEPVAGRLPAQLHLERRDQPNRQLVLRRADRDPRRERRDGLVADVLVDEVGSLPQPVDVDAGVQAEPGKCERRRLGGHAVQRQGDGVHSRSDQVGSGTGRFERCCECVAGRPLCVEADGQAGDLAQLGGQLARPVGLQERCRVVQEDARGAELGQPLRRRDECLVATAPVQQTGVELAAGIDDRLRSLAQVVDVVERVVEPEHVDPALGGTCDETAGEITADRARADEKAAAQRQCQRCLHPRLERADAGPGALDAPVDGAVEHASARHLEIGEAGGVEHLGEAEDVRRRDQPCQRLLPEDANRRIDQTRHRGHLTVGRSYRPATQEGKSRGRNIWS